MSVKVNLAVNGLIGAVTSSAASLAPSNNGETLSANSFYLLTGAADYTVSLPAPAVGEELAGAVIVFKYLSTDEPTITIDGEVIDADTNVAIDGGQVPVELDTNKQSISFYYLDATWGWVTGPATL